MADVERNEYNTGDYTYRLRDQFAIAALTGFAVDPYRANVDPTLLAKQAYELADAMLKVRS